MAHRIAIIMAGGSGQRFWPVSTWERPKPLLSVTPGGETLLQMAAERAGTIADETRIATMPHLAESCLADLPQLQPAHIIVDPAKRNTAGALIWAASVLEAEGFKDSTLAILTADHLIQPIEGFAETARKAFDLAEQGYLVTIGIKPDRPETGFGYIQRGDSLNEGWHVASFKEKPDEETAKEYVSSGMYSWNSGMFFWSLPTFVEQLAKTQPEMARIQQEMTALLAAGKKAEAEALFSDLPSISIDYALMEKSDRVAVVESEFEWDDLGAWDSLPRISGVDEQENAVQGAAILLDSNGCVVRSDDGQEICLLGCQDLIVVSSGGKILVAPKSHAQEVKRLAERFEQAQNR